MLLAILAVAVLVLFASVVVFARVRAWWELRECNNWNAAASFGWEMHIESLRDEAFAAAYKLGQAAEEAAERAERALDPTWYDYARQDHGPDDVAPSRITWRELSPEEDAAMEADAAMEMDRLRRSAATGDAEIAKAERIQITWRNLSPADMELPF